MDAMAAHQSMSKQALNSEIIQTRILTTLLGRGSSGRPCVEAPMPAAEQAQPEATPMVLPSLQ